MKFLHMADLHIGKSVNGFPMMAEQKHAFRQIIGYIRAERPAAVIIAGDVYDRAIPGVEAVRLFDDFLTELADENVAVLLVAGNHDSPERLNYASRLLADKGLHLYGSFDGSPLKVVFQDDYGEVVFWLLPFIKPSSLRGLAGEGESESYDGAISAVLQSAGIDYTSRNVLVSHQFYTKAGLSPVRSESELTPVGGLDAVAVELIEGFDYAALGHLHGGQNVGSAHIRYCGSPVKYSFSEWRQAKSITLVDIKEKGNLTISTLPLTPIHDMREIKGGLMELTRADISLLADQEDYLRVILTDEEEIIDPMGKLRSVYPNVMNLGFENSRADVDRDAVAADAETMETLSTYELFGEFFLSAQGSAMSGEQADIVRELLERPDEE